MSSTPTNTPIAAFLREYMHRGLLFAGHLRELKGALLRLSSAVAPHQPERMRRAALAQKAPALLALHQQCVRERGEFVTWVEAQQLGVPQLAHILDSLQRNGQWPPAPVPELPAALITILPAATHPPASGAKGG